METSTRDAILDSASDCFARYGFRKASVDKIAAGAQVAKGTVYLYCDSKEDLLYQTAHRDLRRWVGDLSAFIDPRRPATEILVEMATNHLRFLQERPLVRDLLCGVLDGHLPGWQPHLDELRAVGLHHVTEVLRLGIRQGVFAADLDVEATAQVLQEMQTSGALLGERTQLDPQTIRRRQLASLRLVFKGLEARHDPNSN